MATSPTMFRDMQNPDTPDLPFAQARFSTMYRDMQNPDTPNLPFAQTTNGCLTCPPLQLSLALCNCPIGNGGKTGGGNTGGGSSGVTKSQIENMIEQYHGDDIKLLHYHAVKAGNRSTTAYNERRRIEDKVNANKAEHQDFHDKLQSLGDALKAHATHDIIPNPIGDILPYLLIGGIALLFLVKKK